MSFEVGQRVIKDSGDYTYNGIIVSIFEKRSGAVRLVVENDDGMLFIFNEKQLKLAQDA